VLSRTDLLSPIRKNKKPERFLGLCTGARLATYATMIGLQLPLSGTWLTQWIKCLKDAVVGSRLAHGAR